MVIHAAVFCQPELAERLKPCISQIENAIAKNLVVAAQAGDQAFAVTRVMVLIRELGPHTKYSPQLQICLGDFPMRAEKSLLDRAGRIAESLAKCDADFANCCVFFTE